MINFVEILQILLGIIALILLVMRIILKDGLNIIKWNFNTQILLIFTILFLTECLELIEEIEETIETLVPWLYALAGIVVLIIIFNKAKKSRLI